MPSFDIVSQVNRQEIDNALNQARKEIGQRYDFKDSQTTIELEEDEIRINSTDDFKVKAAAEVLREKLARRQVPLKALVDGAIEPAGGGRAKQVIKVQEGVSTEKARDIVKRVKDAKLKVQAQIQADQVRVTGKKRDDLQAVMALLKQHDFGLPLQFVNFRE
ncbi:MAG: YajQ family cyclic di-GMP-binding protein [Deltaproteobacteria bacterium]|nr:YajQ family cyclic di-GMP-binding protein [Deltaproteobacteria bacterium]